MKIVQLIYSKSLYLLTVENSFVIGKFWENDHRISLNIETVKKLFKK